MINIKDYINFETIKNLILAYSRIALEKLKEAMKLPYAKFYMALSLVFILFFFIITFPTDMLLRNELKKLENNLVRSLYIGNIDHNLIGMSTISNLYVNLHSGSEISFKEIQTNLDMDPFSLLFMYLRKRIAASFQITGFRYAAPNRQIDFNINGNFKIIFSPEIVAKEGHLSFIIQNMLIKWGDITLPDSMGGLPVDIPPIKISSIIVNSTIQNQTLQIQSAKISGADLRGDIQGNIKLEKMISNSGLNVKILIDSNSTALSKYRDLLARYISSDNKIVLPLAGTLGNPRIDMTQLVPSASAESPPSVNLPSPSRDFKMAPSRDTKIPGQLKPAQPVQQIQPSESE